MEKVPLPDFAAKMAALKLSKKKLPAGKVASTLEKEPKKAPASKSSGATAYCVKCKTQKPMTAVVNATTTNGRKMKKGKCGTCGTGMCKFIKKDSE